MTIDEPTPEHQQPQGFEGKPTEKDFALLTEGDSRLPEHIQCAKCGQIKPRSSFKKRTTHAQAKGWGKSGRYKLEVFSKNCASCRPKLRPPRALSAKELRTRITNGDLRTGAVVAEAMVKQRIKDGKDGIRKGINRRMEKTKRNAWQPLWDNLCTVRTRARKRMEFLKSGKASPTPSVSVITYANATLNLLKKTAETIRHNKRWAIPLPDNLPPNPSWTDLVTKEDAEHIQALLEAIPHEERVRMRHTSILSLKSFVVKSE